MGLAQRQGVRLASRAPPVGYHVVFASRHSDSSSRGGGNRCRFRLNPVAIRPCRTHRSSSKTRNLCGRRCYDARKTEYFHEEGSVRGALHDLQNWPTPRLMPHSRVRAFLIVPRCPLGPRSLPASHSRRRRECESMVDVVERQFHGEARSNHVRS